jgi:hypothetical protein
MLELTQFAFFTVMRRDEEQPKTIKTMVAKCQHQGCRKVDIFIQKVDKPTTGQNFAGQLDPITNFIVDLATRTLKQSARNIKSR